MGNRKINWRKLPARAGVYLFKNEAGHVLYVGKSINIRERVKGHFGVRGRKSEAMILDTAIVESVPVGSELEALLLEAALIKKYLPKYNSRAKDDKHPLYIKITTREEFPKVSTSRHEDDSALTYTKSSSAYFGPFPSSGTVREVLRQIRRVFPYCSQKGIGNKGCFYSHLNLCNPCPGAIVKIEDKELRQVLKRQYRRNIRRIVMLLSGKIVKVKRGLAREMAKFSKKEKFEKAARVRDELRALEYITAPYSPTTAYLENPRLLEDLRETEIKELHQILRLHGMNINKFVSPTLEIKKPRRIECFHISHTGAASAVASMVTFINGEPEKNLYRRFRIRGGRTKDDFSMIREVIKRRLNHTSDWGEPDLIVVDGGKPQLSAARQYLKGEKSFPVIGLAKRLEEIVVPTDGGYMVLRLRSNNPALNLLQRLRDEAHRFAQNYHFKLRLKSLVAERLTKN